MPMPSMTAPGGGPWSGGGGLRCTTTSSGGCLCLGVDLSTFFFGGGGGYVNSTGTYTINSPQNAAALTFMKQLAASGDTQPNPGGTNRTVMATGLTAVGDGRCKCLGSDCMAWRWREAPQWRIPSIGGDGRVLLP